MSRGSTNRRSGRRWIWAIALAVLFPALAIHVSCVAVLGPGNWGSGLEEKVPEIHPASSNPALAPYVEELQQGAPDPDAALNRLPQELRSRASGRVIWADHFAEEDLWIFQSHAGPRWVDEQHVYIARGDAVREIEPPEGMIVEQPVFLVAGGETFAVFTRWNSWHIPALEKLVRYARSWFDERLRPAYSLYRYTLDGGEWAYAGPGHAAAPSPGRRKAAFLRSGALGRGFYSLHCRDLASGEFRTVASLREPDPGSGRSFKFFWSGDSQALFLTGRISGFGRRQQKQRELKLIYLLADGKLYEAGADSARFQTNGGRLAPRRAATVPVGQRTGAGRRTRFPGLSGRVFGESSGLEGSSRPFRSSFGDRSFPFAVQ